MRHYFKKINETNESGFTLIEILVVILIIGILASIAIPVFLNQRKKGVEASMQSDLKNASLVMEQELTQNKGKYPSFLPAYDTQSANNQVALVGSKSSEQSYCLKVTNTSYPDLAFSYSSMEGGFLTKGTACSDSAIAGDTNIVAMKDKKVLVVLNHNGPSGPYNSNMVNSIKSAGVAKVDEITTSLTLDKAKEYDAVFLVGAKWTLSAENTVAARAYYESGGKVFTDGNDATSGNIPLITSSVFRQTSSAEKVDVTLTPTYNSGLSPSFPYTFTAASFTSDDNWYCPKILKPGVITIADSIDPQATSERCATMIGQSTGDARWVHMVMASDVNAYPNPDVSPTVAAIRWLLQ